MGVDGLGVFIDSLQVAGAALGHRTQRFFKNRGQAAGLVAGRGVVVHLAAVDLRVLLPPLDAANQLVRYLGAYRAAREQVLGAVNLGCFAQDGGTAVSHQQVHRCAQGRVGTDAGVTVGAAALQADGDMRSAAGLALDSVGAWQHLLNEGNAFVHRLARAAAVLDVEDPKVLAFFERAVRQPGIDLVGLAAQAHHQHAGKVDVGGIAGQCAL